MLTFPELETRLRECAELHEQDVAAAPDLNRRILARVAITPTLAAAASMGWARRPADAVPGRRRRRRRPGRRSPFPHHGWGRPLATDVATADRPGGGGGHHLLP